jgi:xanthine dehydrogenase accessory factor
MINDSRLTKRAIQLEAEGVPYALATVVSCKAPTSAQPGYKALVTAAGDIYGWIGGGCVQPAVVKGASQVLRDGQPQLIRVSPAQDTSPQDEMVEFKSACFSGGTLDIFIEPVSPRPALLLLGGSEVARSLATLAHFAGFNVTVASPAADETGFPRADQVIGSFEVSTLPFSPPPLVVVATQGKGDQAALLAALHIDTPHRAFIASKRKADKLKQVLKSKGHDPQAVDAIVAPAGVNIGARSPEEIAVSVLAGLIAARHQQTAAPLAQDSGAARATPVSGNDAAGAAESSDIVADTGCCGGHQST